MVKSEKKNVIMSSPAAMPSKNLLWTTVKSSDLIQM